MSDQIYLKIYTEDDNKVLVFEGQGVEDIPGVYYPTKWEENAYRLGTVVIGKEHMRITPEARQAFRRIIREARKTGDDMSCIDIHTCYERKEDGTADEEKGCTNVCVSYFGKHITKLNIEEVIHDDNFFIGCGEGIPAVSLLDAIPDLEESSYEPRDLNYNEHCDIESNSVPSALIIPETGIGDVSDGCHTFNELYHHRAVLFSVICNLMPDKAWKSKLHHEGDMFDGMFIIGIETPDGQATYHYHIEPYWDMFKVQELEKAPKWDGHTPTDAINRIATLSDNITEMVKCKNCKHHHWEQEPCHGKTEHFCSKLNTQIPRDFYCGYGDKK